MTGLALIEEEEKDSPAQAASPITRSQVVRALALDLHYALSRKGRAPFILAGLPMFDDLCALRRTLAQCLSLEDNVYLRHWHTVLDSILPAYQAAFAEVEQAVDWVNDIKTLLDSPLPTTQEKGEDGNTVALNLAHHLGYLADVADLSPWLTQFRDALLDVSERYWSGLFHCYDIIGLPATNNAHESLYGQIKRQLRRQLGISELREALLRRGAWTVFQIDADSPEQLKEHLAQVTWKEYAAERERYERRQSQFCRRYRWRHRRDAVLQQRLANWAEAISDC